MTEGRRICICGNEFDLTSASQTQCPDCTPGWGWTKKAHPRKRNDAPNGSDVKMRCARCLADKPHSFVGSYGGVEFWRCTCGLWRKGERVSEKA